VISRRPWVFCRRCRATFRDPHAPAFGAWLWSLTQPEVTLPWVVLCWVFYMLGRTGACV
jgi:hypothetical protein